MGQSSEVFTATVMHPVYSWHCRANIIPSNSTMWIIQVSPFHSSAWPSVPPGLFAPLLIPTGQSPIQLPRVKYMYVCDYMSVFRASSNASFYSLRRWYVEPRRVVTLCHCLSVTIQLICGSAHPLSARGIQYNGQAGTRQIIPLLNSDIVTQIDIIHNILYLDPSSCLSTYINLMSGCHLMIWTDNNIKFNILIVVCVGQKTWPLIILN